MDHPHSVPPQKKSNKTKIIVIVVVIVGICSIFCCVGLTLGVPAFLRATKKSKGVEAEAIMRVAAQTAAQTYRTTCAFPPALPPTSSPPVGGAKAMVPAATIATWSETLRADIPTGAYFAYSTERSPSTYVITAKADFSAGGDMYTQLTTVTGTNNGGTCTAEISPSVTLFEFE